MKKNTKYICLLICIACLLCSMLSGCWWQQEYEQEPTEEITQPEETEEVTEPVETEPPYLMEGYVNIDSLNIRSGPGSSCELLGKLQKDDYVRIYEVDGKWGKTEIGWIYLGYVKVTQEYPEQPDNTTSNGKPEDTTEPATGNINSALLGKWYRYNRPAGSDMYFVYVYNFKSNGIFTDPCYSFTLEELQGIVVPDENDFMQSYSHFYEIQGNKMLYRMDDTATQQTKNFSINGNVLKFGNDIFYRGNLTDAVNKIRSELRDEGTQNWPPLDTGSPIIGSWYYYKTTGEYCVYTMDFYSGGYCADSAWVFRNNDPQNQAEQVSGAQYEFTLSGGKVLYRSGLYGEHFSEESYSISGNRLILGGQTYYRGTYQDGIEKLKAELGNSQPTEPPAEAPTETPTEAPAEAPTEASTELPDAPTES